MMKNLWKDEGGAIVSAELVLVMTVVVIGVAAGAVALRDSIVEKMSDAAQAIQAIDTSFAIAPVQTRCGNGVSAWVAGSSHRSPAKAVNREQRQVGIEVLSLEY